ncbi:hypothetical protein JCM31447_12270 [Fluviispira sanaruensis]|uniref:Uncharacterized protein n=1 Tax=Fluviispira sanaruensis TaxID=2493639 RepID=A0A4P2VLE8_FLUSA|nr:hypothetical protein JCM31447_12270 [Fluviispira sanaruensis]
MIIRFPQIYIFLGFILCISSVSYSLTYETIQLDIENDTFNASLNDNKCEFILDNNINYEVLKKSENKFIIKANKINEKSATVIFDCEKDQYIYRVLYQHGYSQSSLFYQREFKGKTFLNYNFKMDGRNSATQVIQYVDGSAPNFYFRSSRLEYGNSNYFNNIQLNYSGDKSNNSLQNNLYSGIYLGNGNDNIGKFLIAQTAVGFYEYILTYQQQNYYENNFFSRKISLNIPNPVRLYLTYDRKTDASERYSVQRVFSFGAGNFQSYHFFNYEKEFKKPDPLNNPQLSFVEDTYYLNNFTTYFFTSFIYQQFNSDMYCKGNKSCVLKNLLTTFNFQNFTTRLQFKYNFIPNGFDFYLQKFFLGESDFNLGFSKTFSPLDFFQKSDFSRTNMGESDYKFFSNLNLRHHYAGFFATLSLPLIYLNQNPTANASLEYETKNWIIYSSCLLRPFDGADWRQVNWQLTGGFSYYPGQGLNYALDYMKTHKIKGHVFSNLRMPEENVTVQLVFAGSVIQESSTDDKGYYEFNDVPKKGHFEIKMKKGVIESNAEFTKENHEVEKKAEIDLPYYTVVNLSFVLVKNGIETILSKINNYNAGFSVVSVEGARYFGNKIVLKREKIEMLMLNPEILPFGYQVLKISENSVNTLEKEMANIIVYLKKEE